MPRFAALASAMVLCASAALGCPFCAQLGKSFSDGIAEADFVAHGVLSQPRLTGGGQTTFTITRLLKAPPDLQGRTAATLPRYMAAAADKPASAVVFAEIAGNVIDPYRVMTLDAGVLVEYLAGVCALQERGAADRLAYFFTHLEHADPAIAEDAYKEFAKAPFADVLKASAAFDPDRVRGLLLADATPPQRAGLYGLLLGLRGTPADAQLLRRLISAPPDRLLVGFDGLLGGYCLLEPIAGPELVTAIVADANRSFATRYAAINAARFVLSELPVAHRRFLKDLAAALARDDVADLVIDELRKHSYWDACDNVLLLGRPSASAAPVVRGAVVRYALACPLPQAAAFIATLKETQPQLVIDAEQNLQLEADIARQFGTPQAAAKAVSRLPRQRRGK